MKYADLIYSCLNAPRME